MPAEQLNNAAAAPAVVAEPTAKPAMNPRAAPPDSEQATDVLRLRGGFWCNTNNCFRCTCCGISCGI
ncbi:uncharacterized protein LOC62_02G002624 [Vanrija pseudolonga]|uniref:Uncharacterized protein n=1 Tax=Vanrija pseudolonga TaxID=143232 RepID=A0AAF0Y8W4_9TREE|nr:hypothetical protein LOC62_02G002624 [Vanrija pseudolonga]